ncbi:MAG: hypothetical protein IKL92_02525 [Oscillospiraceae bacterium]|nr:hypothetical protein [Oscillospiraceae bacterium]
MDDIASQISSFLENPDAMAQIQKVAQSLGLGTNEEKPPSSPSIDADTIALFQKAASAYTKSDKNTDLLMALKPHFSPERAKKVDDAVKILALLRLYPLIKDSGFFKKGGR